MESLVQLYMLLAIFCLLLFKSFREIYSNNYSKALLLLLLFITTMKMLREAGVIHSSPLLYVAGNTALFLFIPAVYLYLRNAMYGKKITSRDAVHALSALAYCSSCAVFYMMNNKIGLLQADIFNESGNSQRPALLYFLMMGYGVVGWYLILVLKILKDRYAIPKRNELIAPAALYAAKDQNEISRPVEIHTGNIILSEERISKIDTMIREFLEEQKPFLRHGYSLKQLAEETGLPLHLLSAFINKHYKVNFNDFINEYRVDYCKQKIMNDEWKSKKLEAIAEESGFSNRNTFTAAFKRVTGQNPSEFLKTIKEHQAA